MKRSKVKNVASAMWNRKLERCNPFNEKDLDIQQAKLQLMPKSNMVYIDFRGNPVWDMDELSLSNWADGDAGKNKFPKIEAIARILYVHKYLISALQDEGMSDSDIEYELKTLGFSGARWSFQA